MKKILDSFLTILAFCIVVPLLILLVAGCVILVGLLGVSVWKFFEGGWVLLVWVGVTFVGGFFIHWAFNRILEHYR